MALGSPGRENALSMHSLRIRIPLESPIELKRLRSSV